MRSLFLAFLVGSVGCISANVAPDTAGPATSASTPGPNEPPVAHVGGHTERCSGEVVHDRGLPHPRRPHGTTVERARVIGSLDDTWVIRTTDGQVTELEPLYPLVRMDYAYTTSGI